MNLPRLPNPEFKNIKSFRNIYTIKISQSLFDDLTDEEEFPLLQAWENKGSGIDHNERQANRVFQYGENQSTLTVFDKINWCYSRFSDGKSYGVWYGALEPQTSIQETLYWSYQFCKPDLQKSTKPIVVDRKMLEADLSSPKAVDLRPLTPDYPQLIDPKNYSLCQELGKYAVENKIDFYLNFSARKKEGTCLPVFDLNSILRDRFLYYFHFTFYPDGRAQITTDQDEWISI